MNIMYRARTVGFPVVQTVEVERETDKSVWIKNFIGHSIRHPKESNFHNYFDTFDDAKQCCVNTCVQKIDGLQSRLDSEQEILINFLSIAEADVKPVK